ncbi:MAG: methyltransferase domain-containing protein [Thermoguttaceae bacterium]|nr:methyltransferase domain-containing protein [Thermoguttaceae bacterium]
MNDAREKLFALTGGWQTVCVILAASELDLFTEIIKRGTATAEELARELKLDLKGTTYLLAALTSLELTTRTNGAFQVVDEFAPCLDSRSPNAIAPMLRHQANCLRNWAQLAWTVKSGVPIPSTCGVNDAFVEFQDFILAMDVIAKKIAPVMAQKLLDAGLLDFERMLDLGGASGTYSFAFLEKNPDADARSVLFDRPAALEEAKNKAANSPYADRLEYYPGDFYVTPYPTDVDFVWISAIIHQQGDDETEKMFKRSFDALRSGGRVGVRDVYINDDFTGPKPAAFFGLNMLVRRKDGKVYNAKETIALLTKVGFQNARLALPADDMTAVIVAEKP